MLLILTLISFFQFQCKKQLKRDYSESISTQIIKKDSVLSYNVYSNQKDAECNKWKSHKNINILKFINQFKEININEWQQCFGNFPCGIKGELIKKNKKFEYNLNSGGWIQLKHNNDIFYLGSKNKKDTIVFLSVYYCDEEWGK